MDSTAIYYYINFKIIAVSEMEQMTIKTISYSVSDIKQLSNHAIVLCGVFYSVKCMHLKQMDSTFK